MHAAPYDQEREFDPYHHLGNLATALRFLLEPHDIPPVVAESYARAALKEFDREWTGVVALNERTVRSA
jgi:hypothetical protein